MDISRDETIFGTTFHTDGTLSGQVIRDGDDPSEEHRAMADAIRLADAMPFGVVPTEFFDARAPHGEGPFRSMVLRLFLAECARRGHPSD